MRYIFTAQDAAETKAAMCPDSQGSAEGRPFTPLSSVDTNAAVL